MIDCDGTGYSSGLDGSRYGRSDFTLALIFRREFVPELGGTNKRWVHQPWDMRESERVDSGVPESYPVPIVSLATSRMAALAAYQRLRRTPTRPS